jgi:hypothetical protein
MAEDGSMPNPSEQVARLYEQAETQAAQASERLVGSQGFASVLGQLAENAAALTKLGNDALDLMIRNLRIAGRRDVIRLARQLGRTEDKLERVLQELEELRDQVGDQPTSASSRSSSRRRSSNGSGNGPARARRSGRSARASTGDTDPGTDEEPQGSS